MNVRIDMQGNAFATRFGKRFAGLAVLLDQSTLPSATRELVGIRVSQINGCGICVDMHTKDAAAAGETPVRLNLVAAWRESTVFTDAERAVLALTEEATRLADLHRGVSDETWAEVSKHFDEDQLVALICLIGMVNAANRMNVIARTPGGSYRAGMFAEMMR